MFIQYIQADNNKNHSADWFGIKTQPGDSADSLANLQANDCKHPRNYADDKGWCPNWYTQRRYAKSHSQCINFLFNNFKKSKSHANIIPDIL